MAPCHDTNIYFADMLPFLVIKIPGTTNILVKKWGAFQNVKKREVYFHLDLLNLTNFER